VVTVSLRVQPLCRAQRQMHSKLTHGCNVTHTCHVQALMQCRTSTNITTHAARHSLSRVAHVCTILSSHFNTWEQDPLDAPVRHCAAIHAPETTQTHGAFSWKGHLYSATNNQAVAGQCKSIAPQSTCITLTRIPDSSAGHA